MCLSNKTEHKTCNLTKPGSWQRQFLATYVFSLLRQRLPYLKSASIPRNTFTKTNRVHQLSYTKLAISLQEKFRPKCCLKSRSLDIYPKQCLWRHYRSGKAEQTQKGNDPLTNGNSLVLSEYYGNWRLTSSGNHLRQLDRNHAKAETSPDRGCMVRAHRSSQAGRMF